MKNENSFFGIVNLNLTEKQYYHELKSIHMQMNEIFAKPEYDTSMYPSDLELRGADLSLKLYKSLKKRGITVSFPAELIKNRYQETRTGPEELNFYKHPHAIEDLIKFIQ